MPIGVRAARSSDVDPIAAITLAAWSARDLPAAALASLDPHAVADLWSTAVLTPPSPRHRVVVATDDRGTVCGYAAFGPSDDPDAQDDETALHALEVAPARTREGHGSRLLHAVADLCGTAAVTTWCGVDDRGRRTFLEAAGWGEDSAWREVEVAPGLVVRELRFVTALPHPGEAAPAPLA